MNDDENSQIHKLEKQLYSRDYTPKPDKRTEIKSKEIEGLQSDWSDTSEPSGEDGMSKKKKPEGFYIKWILISSILFFLVSFVIAAFIFLRGNVVSPKNVDIRILGPVSIGGGEELALEIIVDNKNEVDMEEVAVFVEYPEGTRIHDNLDEELVRDRQDYGTIGAGRNIRKTFKSVLFGEQDSVKEIRVLTEYKVRGSNATFEKEKNYEIQISSSPIRATVDYPQEVISDREIEFVVNIASNSSIELNNVVLKVEYPFGFSFTESNPRPAFDTDMFSVGTLEPEEEKTITIRGQLKAQDNEERTFQFLIGSEKDGNAQELGAIYTVQTKTVRIAKPKFELFVGAPQSISIEDEVLVPLRLINRANQDLSDASVKVTFLNTDMVDRFSIKPSNGGFYRSVDDVIVWDKDSAQNLTTVEDNDKAGVMFSFTTVPGTSQLFTIVQNPRIDFRVDVAALRAATETSPIQKIEDTTIRTVKIRSDLDLSQTIRYASGPIPPKAEQRTEYIVDWELNNTFNDLSDVFVKAKLPFFEEVQPDVEQISYVSWVENLTPGEDVIYNSDTEEIIWRAGLVRSGTGYSSTKRKVSFKIVFLPSISQIGDAPDVLRNITTGGTDTYTNDELSEEWSDINTELLEDPVYSDRAYWEVVQ